MESYSDREPQIIKAKFIITNSRIYNLEFDQNIQMRELKQIIQVAAHRKKSNFRLYSEGKEYTQYNDETFESLFPNQNSVVFTLEITDGEYIDDSELILQINSPCDNHPEKFLLFYCFDCNCSICSDCFTHGIHKDHRIQDKCFYLLPSKFLVEKLFDSINLKTNQELKLTANLSELKNHMNNVLFVQLIQMLQEVQNKCNNLIDIYNNVNINSLQTIKGSIKDIKISCIQALDELKDKLNIKDIVNNPQVFKDFDICYKKLGKTAKENFEKNLEIFRKLNQKDSILVSNLIEKIYNLILETLKQALNEEQYNQVKNEINQKIILPVDPNSISNQFKDDKNRRKTYN